jgi:2-oxo-3-hexenedioate decarboxylase
VTPAEGEAILRSTRSTGALIDPFTDSLTALDERWAYEIQDLDRDQRLLAGESSAGAKLGLTSRAKQVRMSVDRPILGFLTNAMLVQSDEVTERLSTWVQPRIEPEIAFITSRDIDRPFAVDEASSYVEFVLLAAEILDSRYAGYRFRLPDVIADNTSAAGFVLAPDRHSLIDLPDLADLRCEVRIDGDLVHEATGSAILGAPLESLVLLAEHLTRRKQVLPAGSLVLAGALTDASPLQVGRRFDLSVERLGSLSIHL